MKKTLFIINPIAGVEKKKNIPELIKQYLDTNLFEYEITSTKYAGHGKELAQQAINKYELIVAVGGDGTINEIAGALVGSKTILGIIPMGSGNGLARHLKIPLNTVKAIKYLNDQRESIIDTCTLNGQAFFCTAGVGFDGYIAKVFDEQSSRGLWTYVKCTIKALKDYKPKTYKLKNKTVVANLVTVANANQFGNDVLISPLSNIQDGKLEVCIIRRVPSWSLVSLCFKIITKKIHTFKYYEAIPVEEVTIENPSQEFVHLDGEPIETTSQLHFKVIPDSLHVST
ncbi:MAG: diacylglycerol kinase family lipid kinase [Cytophagales bacterium]|nr:diacylglycerol kinase family lipid kinase [Cytophagales bacterium]